MRVYLHQIPGVQVRVQLSNARIIRSCRYWTTELISLQSIWQFFGAQWHSTLPQVLVGSKSAILLLVLRTNLMNLLQLANMYQVFQALGSHWFWRLS